ncbi:hypothetical protein BVC93_18335 [Mycobacterium sp. MS1601]|nr:hypothetical protein [Mycobacterium sp. MS1601]AQA06505.1 hypothetical protein BVC93_18335 [Mycobacterium sp. MS1601]
MSIATPADREDPAAADESVRVVILLLLAVDGVLCAVAAALLLPYRLGGVPMPLSAVIAGLLNLALVWAASYWTTSNGLAALPLWTWLATVALMTFGGPGGDVVFGGTGVLAYSAVLLILFGASPAAFWLWVRSQKRSVVP